MCIIMNDNCSVSAYCDIYILVRVTMALTNSLYFQIGMKPHPHPQDLL